MQFFLLNDTAGFAHDLNNLAGQVRLSQYVGTILTEATDYSFICQTV